MHPLEPSERDDLDIRERIEDQRDADFYHQPDEFPLDEGEDEDE
jgi:hypothetical protein